MKAMILNQPRKPLKFTELIIPSPDPSQLLVKVLACGVCRTDLHVVDGELPEPKLPLIPGHEIVGRVVEKGRDVERFKTGERVGIPWLGKTCGVCNYCKGGQENLCDSALFTGYTIDGGYAEYTVANENFCFKIPESYSDEKAAPLLCAGLIGYRSLRMTGEAKNLGLYGFGAAAHIIIQVAIHEGREVYAFTSPGDRDKQHFALSLGAIWAGDSTEKPPQMLDAAIIYAPVGSLIPSALKAVRKGGVVVCAGIHMSDIPSFPYRILWEERVVRSVANLTRRDGEEFMEVAAKVRIKNETTPFPLEKANEALDALRSGRLKGAAVLLL
ncbi:MAG: zinc-dependent alcohol dehydrogenase family protein [Spirochaetota bacterium]